jgi:dipeptidyl aminopeptidase/acylaminoacyl peptidase
MRRIARALVVPALALLCAGPALAQPPGQQPAMLLLDKEALLVAPPDLVSPWEVSRAEWSPDGQYVLAVRNYVRVADALTAAPGPPPVDVSLVLWSAQTRKSQELLKLRGAGDTHWQFEWLAGAPVAMVLVDQPPPPASATTAGPQRWLYRLDARRGLIKVVTRVGPEARVSAAPTQPIAVVHSVAESSVLVVKSDGTVLRRLAVPQGRAIHFQSWAADGQRVLLTYDKPGTPTPSLAWMTLDVVTGKTDDGRAPYYRAPETRLPYSLGHGEATAKLDAQSLKIRPLWIEAPEVPGAGRAMVCQDAEWGRLSPRGDAVLYASDGTVSVRSLVRIPKEAFLAAQAAAARQVVLSNGKQIGLALAMYAQDNNETYPSSDEAVTALLQPYLQNESVFAGFVYVFAGGKISDIADPRTALLGYIPGDQGRANIFADGHVEWGKE